MAPGIKETVTIINNSGKIISTSKQLLGIFKEAKASYKDKKSAIHHERSLQRAHTFDPRHHASHDQAVYYEQQYEYEYGHNPPYELDDARSHASGRSRRSHRSHRSGGGPPARPALTVSNLQAHSEVSATSPSAPPPGYRSPYAETAPRDLALSRPTLARAPTEAVLYEHHHPPPAYPLQRADTSPMLDGRSKKRPKEVDMDLAYGNVPPDLATRTDLDPASSPSAAEARNLVGVIEGLLEEAQCAQHSAGATITHLQRNPEAAAAVALTLAELSAIVTKMSPALLGAMKGGSPAVFALLASPQFLIAAGAAVGVTVVMFGGWKIIKRIKDDRAATRQALTLEAMTLGPGPAAYPPSAAPGARELHPHDLQQQHHPGGEVYYYHPEDEADEALVIEQELSGIESWVRGISPFGENGEADTELISPEAQRAIKRERRERRARRREQGLDDDDDEAEPGPDDSISRSGCSERSHRSHRSSRSSRRHRDSDYDRDEDVSEAGSRRSSRSKRSSVRTIEARKEDGLELVFREKKGNNLLRSIFKKKKDKEKGEERGGRAMSIMV